jgi:hypothetical protein
MLIYMGNKLIHRLQLIGTEVSLNLDIHFGAGEDQLSEFPTNNIEAQLLIPSSPSECLSYKSVKAASLCISLCSQKNRGTREVACLAAAAFVSMW